MEQNFQGSMFARRVCIVLFRGEMDLKVIQTFGSKKMQIYKFFYFFAKVLKFKYFFPILSIIFDHRP